MTAQPNLDVLFRQLNNLLSVTEHWWSPRLFDRRGYPWSHAAGMDLGLALQSLTDEEVTTLAASLPALTQWLKPWLPEAQALLELSLFPEPEQAPQVVRPTRMHEGIPGRKWQQVEAFAQAWQPTADTVLEWCSGKGHLGRLLATSAECSVSSLEWNERLCQVGSELAHKYGVKQQFVHANAMEPRAAQQVATHDQVVALHACGDLHVTLLRHWAKAPSRRLAIVPCCYQLVAGDTYQPLSLAAQASTLRLSKYHLSIPLQELVTAGAREHRQREQELLWRLAFDEWQREQRGMDEYLSVPGLRGAQLAGSFSEFVWGVARIKGLDQPASIDESLWLKRGAIRKAQVRRAELVLKVFRRPLELWLLLDRVLFLAETGARVSVFEFCSKTLTPRNMMITADRL